MPACGASAAAPGSRRARYLIPRELPRRADLIAGLVTVAVLGHLLFAQLTLVFAVALYLIGRAVRWRWTWLTVPAGVGLAWALAIGPGVALSGLVAGPRQVAAYLAGIPGEPGRLLHLGAAFTGAAQWLPRQLPLALVLGSAEAAFLGWLDWLHTDAAAVRPARTGLIVAARRWYTRRAIRKGGVLTRDGSRLGVAADGRSAAVSWAEAEGGVLVAGRQAGPAVPGAAAPAGGAGRSSRRAAALFSRRATRRDEGAPRSEEGRQRLSSGPQRAASTASQAALRERLALRSAARARDRLSRGTYHRPNSPSPTPATATQIHHRSGPGNWLRTASSTISATAQAAVMPPAMS